MQLPIKLPKNGIYLIKNIINGRTYIGSSMSLHQRLWTHIRALRIEKHPNLLLQIDYRTHGKRAFQIEIIQGFYWKKSTYERVSFLKQEESKLIRSQNPYYNNRPAKGTIRIRIEKRTAIKIMEIASKSGDNINTTLLKLMSTKKKLTASNEF